MTKLTPMMAQYRQIKDQHKDCILMYRLGDFYEMFFEDAIEAAKILQITLTARNKNSENNAPMCGIPYHAVDGYLAKLTKAGKKVALCDQMTQPDGKGIVEREVVRVVTPGTTFDENILDTKANNYVAAIVAKDGVFAFAYADVTTGEFKVTELKSAKELGNEFLRIGPAECIGEENLIQSNLIRDLKEKSSKTHFFHYDYFGDSKSSLKEYFGLKSLQVFALETKELAIKTAALLFNYLKETQKSDLKHIQKISYYSTAEFMPLDEAMIRNLELFFTNREERKEGSLIWVLDQTVTSMGGRMIRNWLLHPLLNRSLIEKRLNCVEVFVGNSSLLREVRESLSEVADIERLLSRLSLGTGNARDLIAMKESLKVVPKLKEVLNDSLPVLAEGLDNLSNLVELVEKAIMEEPPMTVREGGMIKSGFNTELDELRGISTQGKSFITDLQEREIKRTGINSMKVRFNSVFGYYIEISKTNLAAVPADYVRKQTLVNAERFITPELKEYEEKVLTAEERIKEIEYELFYKVRMEIIREILKIQKNARLIAELDALEGLAFLAVRSNYSRPEILENGEIFIKNGRHPVVESLGLHGSFVPNDCVMNISKNFLLITGPNMGGKSTYLRQIALIVLMAQIGSYVPTESARLGVVDRIFTRVGASDNLARGESTFMVEMTEAGYILNNATEKSLIILDEIGRGTSTYDGVSIAWAISEFLHDKVKAKTLFATHYHELIELAGRLERAANLSVAVKENEKEGVVFLYKIVEGGVDKSYGIEVAKLAGLPTEVVARAREVLDELESREIKKGHINPDQIELFNGGREYVGLEKDHDVLKELKEIDLNRLTPIEAIQKLDKMKKKITS